MAHSPFRELPSLVVLYFISKRKASLVRKFHWSIWIDICSRGLRPRKFDLDGMFSEDWSFVNSCG